MFNRIRNSIASLIAVKAADTPATRAADAAQDRQEQDRRIRILQTTTHAEPRQVTVGHITTEDLLDFGSKYSRSAVAQLGCWSAIARGFSEFVKAGGRASFDAKNPKSDKLDAFCLEFHAWNAVAGEGEMDENATLETIARLSQVKPAKGDKQTDAIIARVLNKSVEEVKADREAKAAVATKRREEGILAFNTILWSCVYSEGTYTMPAERVLNKLEQTLLWMAGWDTTNPASLAAELLLVEADMQTVKQVAAKSVGACADFEEGVMCADTISRNMAA